MKERFLTVWRSSLLFALVLNAVSLAACIIFTSFTYGGTADYLNSVLICQNHIYANASINYLLAILIGTAQYAFPNINCFVLFEVMASFAAFVSITFVFAELIERRPRNDRLVYGFTALELVLFGLFYLAFDLGCLGLKRLLFKIIRDAKEKSK